jgi:hypothetical protein
LHLYDRFENAEESPTTPKGMVWEQPCKGFNTSAPKGVELWQPD